MAIETFQWSPRTNAAANATFRIRKAQFGDGYAQVAGDGINFRAQNWDLNFVGSEAYISAIAAFLDRHAGRTSFQWKPPLSPLGLYRCEQYKPKALGGGNFSLSATFIQAFHP